MPDFEILEATIDGIHAAFRDRRLTARELVQGYLARIQAYDRQGPDLRAIQSINPDALAQAETLDRRFASSGPSGPLHGIPVLLKDQVEVEGMPTTFGSALFKDFYPRRDATIVRRLKEAGAIVLAKTTMGEFAAGFVGSAFGFCRNAYDPTRNPSGSSSGTGTGLAANFGAVGIGEDTAGSIRGPAAHNNLVGLRPTVPLVSRFGMMPAAPSRDTLGPMARTVRDLALVLDVIAGFDANDPPTAASAGQIPATFTSSLDIEGLHGARLGVIRHPLAPDTDPTAADYARVWAVAETALKVLADRGATILDPVAVPSALALIKAGFGESESQEAIDGYLAGLDGAPVKSLQDLVLSDVVVPSRRSRLANGLGKSTRDYAYLAELQARQELREQLLMVMAENNHDALVYPTYDHEPLVIPDDAVTRTANVGMATLSGENRRLASVTAFPAISVPAGFTQGILPVGLELLGRPFSEGTLLRLAYAFEQATHHRRPPATTPSLAS
jgi:amidase